jgi:hypothetical protein
MANSHCTELMLKPVCHFIEEFDLHFHARERLVSHNSVARVGDG